MFTESKQLPSLSKSIVTGAIGFGLVSLCVFATVAFAERWMHQNLGPSGSYIAWIVLFILLSGAVFGSLVVAARIFLFEAHRGILTARCKTMTTEQVENEALKLKPEARADLAEKLLRSLEDLSDEDVERLWAEEAVRRDAELDAGTASMRDVEDVLRDIRARIS